MESFCKLICTSFTEDKLRGEWIEECKNLNYFLDFCNGLSIKMSEINYPQLNTISEVFSGYCILGNVKVTIHFRIIR